MGPLQQIMGTPVYPRKDMWEGSILFIENFSPYGSPLAALHAWRAFAASGALEKAGGLLTGSLGEEKTEILLKFLKDEVHREDLPVLANVDFCHRTPMTVLPIGAMAEIDCDQNTFSILESGTL